MNLDDRQRAPVPLVHRPRHSLVAVAALFSSSARAAGTVALERQRRERIHRLVSVARDAIRERSQPTRPRMRSVVLTRPGRLDWWDTPVPAAPAPGGAIVMPLAMATCDLDPPVGLGATPFPTPLHFGHESVGEVLAVGEAVRTVRPGDRVAVPFQISCGTCPACRNRLTGNCRSVPPISMYGFGLAGGAWGGVFAEQVSVPYADAMLVPLPAGVDPVAVASVADTLSDAYRHIGPYVERIRRHPEGPSIILFGAVRRDSVFGASVPLYAAQIARALVPEANVLVVEARAAVREHAARLGFEACEPKALGRRQAPLVVDSSADPRGLTAALRATAPDGICTCAGTLHASVKIPAARMFGRNSTLKLARSHIRTVIPKVLDLVAAGRIRPELVTTTIASFEDAPKVLSDHLRGAATKTILVRTA